MINSEQLKFEWLAFLSAMSLMSRIPVDLFLSGTELTAEHHNRAQIWYPWTGAVLGLFLLAGLWLAPSGWSPFLTAVILVSVWVCYSGALHLDGLADSVDAWVGGMGGTDIKSTGIKSAGRTLRIMKDPASGPMAVVALVLVLLLKVALVSEILRDGYDAGIAPLVLLPLFARAWLLPFLYKTPYARLGKFDAQNVQSQNNITSGELSSQQGGMATDIAVSFPKRGALVSFLCCQALFFSVSISISGFWIWLAINLSALALCALLHKVCVGRVGGYTGDVLGALIELQEILMLLVLNLTLAFSVAPPVVLVG